MSKYALILIVALFVAGCSAPVAPVAPTEAPSLQALILGAWSGTNTQGDPITLDFGPDRVTVYNDDPSDSVLMEYTTDADTVTLYLLAQSFVTLEVRQMTPVSVTLGVFQEGEDQGDMTLFRVESSR